MKVVVAGDFCPRDRVAKNIECDNWTNVLNDVKPVTLSADLSIVNLECPIVKDKDTPIVKKGPILKCVPESLAMIKDSGFGLVTLANNHFRDQGNSGVENTISAIRSYGLDYVGGGLNYEDSAQTYFFQKDNERIAVINCCEHEFSISDEYKSGSNPLNPIQQWYAIQDAKTKADYVLLIVHGGHEHFQLPSPRMQETYRFFIDAGADVVVNHHQHCYSGYEVYKGKPIFYGIGNFCMDDSRFRNHMWNEGFLVDIEFGKNVEFVIIPFTQGDESENVQCMAGDRVLEFQNHLHLLNTLIEDPVKLKIEYNRWVEKSSNGYLLDLVPYSGKILRKLVSKGLIPKFLTKRRALSLYNNIQCESHRDRLLAVIKSYICQ